SIKVKMTVDEDKPVVNEAAGEMMSADDFYLDAEDIDTLTDAIIIDRADAQAWNPETDERISISRVEYEISKQNGTYPVTFFTSAGTCVTSNMIVDDVNRDVNEDYGEEIYAVNIFKTVDDIQESIALKTDLKIWANAVAFDLEDGSPVEITDVIYDFDPETITPGEYYVTFKTTGYTYRVDTTDKTDVGAAVGLAFTPEDLHIMSKTQGED
ncbi:MAG: ABC transporter ATP-binding protein, partial [Lachnospiraceae bacterium]|nr:ABC transporter ATP-binding protein [Lachnospiraceae bacterium]